jgi:hypothetical protein
VARRGKFAKTSRPAPQVGPVVEPCGTGPGETDYAHCIPKFCERPYETVCGNRVDWETRRRADGIQKFRESAEKKALRATALELGIRDPDGFAEEDIAKLKGKKQRIAIAAYIKTLYGEIDKKLKGTKESIASRMKFIRANIDRGLLVASQFSSFGELPEDARKARDTLKKVRLTFASEVFNDPNFIEGENEESSEEMIKDYLETCGDDGFEDNAFASTYGDVPRLILCPGALMATVDQTDPGLEPGEKFMVGMTMTMGHEIAHHFDSSVYPKLYENYQSCLAKGAAAQLGQPDRLEDYLPEVTADYWGTEAIVRYMRDRAPTPHKKFVVLKRVLDDLCDTPDDGTHPSGQWRIDGARMNLELHRLLGCPPPRDASRFCTLAGETEPN